MRFPRTYWLFLSIGCSIYLAGCGSSYNLAPVEGTVKYNGQAVEGWTVSFSPKGAPNAEDAGPGSTGTTDSSGHYSLKTIDGADGAIVGTHRVVISPPQDDPDSDVSTSQVRVPAKFTDGSMEFEVKEGSNTKDWAIP